MIRLSSTFFPQCGVIYIPQPNKICKLDLKGTPLPGMWCCIGKLTNPPPPPPILSPLVLNGCRLDCRSCCSALPSSSFVVVVAVAVCRCRLRRLLVVLSRLCLRPFHPRPHPFHLCLSLFPNTPPLPSPPHSSFRVCDLYGAPRGGWSGSRSFASKRPFWVWGGGEAGWGGKIDTSRKGKIGQGGGEGEHPGVVIGKA